MTQYKALLSASSLPPHKEDRTHYVLVTEIDTLLEREMTGRIDTGVAYGGDTQTEQAKEAAQEKLATLGWTVTGAWELSGDTWYIDVTGGPREEDEEDEEEAPEVTSAHVRELLRALNRESVLFVNDEGELEVWSGALVSHHQIVAHQHQIQDDLGGPDHPDGPSSVGDILDLLPGLQAKADEITGH